MKYLKNILPLIITAIFTILISSFSEKFEKEYTDVIILKLMGKELESVYYINDGKEVKVREGLTVDEALENYLSDGYKIEGTSVASDAGRFSIVYTLTKKK